MNRKPTGHLSSIPRSAGGIARLACNRLLEEGKPLAPALSGAGLTIEDIQDSQRRLTTESQIKFLELAARELPDDHLGFRLAQEFELGQIGLVYYVMASSEHLIDALHNAERYCTLNDEGVRLRISNDRALTIGLEYQNVTRPWDCHHCEFWLTGLLRICRELTRTRLAPRQIKFRHLRTSTPSDVRAHLGCDITYSAGSDEMTFPARVASMPVTGADIHLNELLRRYADEALGERASGRGSTRSQVEDLLVQLLPNGKANLSEIANRIGMSRRTLARVLSAEGTTFSAVLNNLRVVLAMRYLREQQLPISQIAWLLGYQEVSSFTHAFIGWAGQTPSAFRAAASAN